MHDSTLVHRTESVGSWRYQVAGQSKLVQETSNQERHMQGDSKVIKRSTEQEAKWLLEQQKKFMTLLVVALIVA
jgi:hypothetical protein